MTEPTPDPTPAPAADPQGFQVLRPDNTVAVTGTSVTGSGHLTIITAPAPVAPSQVRHPWRATARTAIALALGVASTVPDVLATLHLDGTVIGGQALAVALGATRVMALPKVNDLLTRYGLGAEPKP